MIIVIMLGVDFFIVMLSVIMLNIGAPFYANKNGSVAIVKRSSLLRQVVNSTGESVMAFVTGLGKKSEMLCCC